MLVRKFLNVVATGAGYTIINPINFTKQINKLFLLKKVQSLCPPEIKKQQALKKISPIATSS
jgi:hypothetical protein